jgi:hypothetical protein
MLANFFKSKIRPSNAFSFARSLVAPSTLHDQVFELRRIRIRPGLVDSFLEKTSKFLQIRERYVKLLGYWTTSVGDQNETYQLWRYPNFDAYDEADAALRVDEDWNRSYLHQVLPMVESQQNMVLGQYLWAPYTDQKVETTTPGIYRLCTTVLHPGSMEKWQKEMIPAVKARSEHSKPIGFFYSQIGDMNRIFHLWRYDSMGDRARVLNKAMSDPRWTNALHACLPMTERMEHIILRPTAFSPLQ